MDHEPEINPLLESTYSSSDNTLFDTANFECNICFELAQEPIVTLCGHLYCWPCLYQWLRLHSHSHECPVCKSIVQEDKLVPIFGRGKSNQEFRSRSYTGITIPNRPMGQRPQTAPRVDMSSFVRPDDVDPITGFMPMAAARSCNCRNGGMLTLTLSFSSNKTVFSKLKTSENQSRKKGKKAILQVPTTTKIEAPEPGGTPVDAGGGSGGGTVNPPPSAAEGWGKKLGSLGLKGFPRKVLSVLSNLPLAIAEMFAVAALMALGTFVEQGEAPDFYFQKYPEDNPAFGFFTWRWIFALGLDHMFSSPTFLITLSLLGASLMACTYTTQIPLVKVAKRWSFLHSAETIRKQEYSDDLPRASIQDLGVILMGSGYKVFLKGPTLYAFKGLAGRFAPIGVHLALLLIMCGGTLSATGSFRGSVTVPQGLNFVIGDVLGPTGFLSTPSESFNTEVHVSQFHSDLSLFDINGKEVMRKTISVNDPLRYGGVTIYQTDWSLSALQIMKDDEGPFNLALAPLKINGDKKLYGTFLPIGDNSESTNLKGISMLARDMQSIVLYDQEGKFAGVRRPNSKLPIDIDGIKIDVLEAIGSTGLELKTDPGVPIVYTGFGALMLTTCISFLSHTQLWALQDGTTVVIGGKTNRAKGEFSDDMNILLDQVPELVDSSGSRQSDNISS
ncbi:cytochrome c biogenesis protein family [Striga asiatica]|uniref:Cytochrome c biogenesis protein family n=1 Tax=Striga asiatica TaxID=4170 RepID=A0A5A7QYB1_STRAF|nr:cytochrome c biogenesis protein family [Striga asiatica]